jgi:hypothetical protein
MASATPCQGRLAIITLPDKDKTPIAFVKRPEDKKPILFSAPKACSGIATVGEEHLCPACQERSVKTAAAVEKAGGKYVANQQTLLHGRFGEPLPEWSHMFGSRWFVQTQAEKRLEIPEVVATLLPKSDTQPPVEMPPKRRVAGEPSTQPTEVKPEPKKRAPKKVAAKAEAVAVAPAPIVVPEAAVAAAVAPVDATSLVPKRKFAPKKKAAAAQPIPEPTLGVIQSQPLEGLQVKKISVRRTTIDDRTVYLSAEKDKVYDMKFNYIGRYNRRDERIESKYADSDREV